ncbi:MAG: BamA/TamA family outer membrane protein [Candidatus Kapabacteria bacterium]|nr:BamA/TamA family outer membrane protein [Candidatus Kapabacteria bacterium]
MYKLFSYILIILLCCINVYPQSNGSKTELIPSPFDKSLAEIGKIEYIGNKTFTDEELNKINNLRPSERNVFHRIFQYYLNEISQNRATPPPLIDAFKMSINTMVNELRFYEPIRVKDEIDKIKNFYEQKGFHNASVRYTIEPDYKKMINIIKVFIEENDRWKISNIKYIGLDSLPDDIKERTNKLKLLKIGDYFDEIILTQEVVLLNRFLLDNGYFYTKFEIPLVTIDTLKKQDSITIIFHTGKRQRFGEIYIVDKKNGQQSVGYNMKLAQLEIKKGDWYSLSKINRSLSNLLSLGTFDFVSIDTSTAVYPKTDTSIPFKVELQYRKQQEYGIGIFSNRTVIDNYLNGGIEASYIHRNIFGSAQVLNPYARFVIQNMSEALYDRSKALFEFQIGVNFAQPLLWTIDVSRIGLTVQPLYSVRTVYNQLRINTFSLPIKFPVSQPKFTYIHNFSVDFNFERELPLNFSDAKKRMLENATTREDSVRVEEISNIYGNLDEFVRTKNPIFTSTSFGMSLISDTRDNPFSPNSGHFAIYSFELPFSAFTGTNSILGNNKFLRFQLANYWFWGLNNQLVLALKQREGFIYWWNKAESFIPFEKQFFAGGANSVRGWPSRRLRYTKRELNLTGSAYDYAVNFVGNSILIEGSLELRYRFASTGSGLIAEQIANFGITGFLDWGNAFNWLLLDDNTKDYIDKYNWWEFGTGLALALGLGLRYETPVGPFRIDFAWPLYDPNRKSSDKFIFNRRDGLSAFTFHVGLGHSY